LSYAPTSSHSTISEIRVPQFSQCEKNRAADNIYRCVAPGFCLYRRVLRPLTSYVRKRST